MLIRNSSIDYLNDGISYVIDSELDNESKLRIIKNLINLSQEHKYLNYEGLKCLKDNVDKRVKELKSK